jgi:hypothetical protein
MTCPMFYRSRTLISQSTLLIQSSHSIEFVLYAGYTGQQWKEPHMYDR